MHCRVFPEAESLLAIGPVWRGYKKRKVWPKIILGERLHPWSTSQGFATSSVSNDILPGYFIYQNTRWHITLFHLLCWHEYKSCILICAPYTKMRLFIWCQWNLENKVMCHPIVSFSLDNKHGPQKRKLLWVGFLLICQKKVGQWEDSATLNNGLFCGPW